MRYNVSIYQKPSSSEKKTTCTSNDSKKSTDSKCL